MWIEGGTSVHINDMLDSFEERDGNPLFVALCLSQCTYPHASFPRGGTA